MSKFGLQFQIGEGKCTIFVLDRISLLLHTLLAKELTLISNPHPSLLIKLSGVALATAYDLFIPPPPLSPNPPPHCSLDKLPLFTLLTCQKLKWALEQN
jgi:hypothetical protein